MAGVPGGGGVDAAAGVPSKGVAGGGAAGVPSTGVVEGPGSGVAGGGGGAAGVPVART